MKKIWSILLALCVAAGICVCGTVGANAATQSTPIIIDDDPSTLADMARYEEMAQKRREFHLAKNITDKYLAYLARNPSPSNKYTQYGREINGKCNEALLAADNKYELTQDYKAFNAAVLEAWRQLHVAEFDGYRIYLKVAVPDEIWVFYGEDPAAHVSQGPSGLLYWILRYLFFGWIWM